MRNKGIAVLVLVVCGVSCARNQTDRPPSSSISKEEVLRDFPKDSLRTHYLIDYEYFIDSKSLFATMGHLVVFNPNARDVELGITVYYEDRAPNTFSRVAPAKTSLETNYGHWPVHSNTRFALKVESTEAVICQATNGWNNADNNYRAGAKTSSPKGIRETAKSYMSINRLSREGYLADGIVINDPGKLWIKESEWAIILNPNDQDAQVTLLIYDSGTVFEHRALIAGKRVKWIFMDELAKHNRHYGVRFVSDQAVAAQWLRTVNWYDSPELMAFWSVPFVPHPAGVK
ncbi:MAG: hypothetical protein L0338_11845 [Acidobacteria bacterium]|nr:hypothetical protein [Acidobacteriota bacterium]